jgi:hypothetical protein
VCCSKRFGQFRVNLEKSKSGVVRGSSFAPDLYLYEALFGWFFLPLNLGVLVLIIIGFCFDKKELLVFLPAQEDVRDLVDKSGE